MHVSTHLIDCWVVYSHPKTYEMARPKILRWGLKTLMASVFAPSIIERMVVLVVRDSGEGDFVSKF